MQDQMEQFAKIKALPHRELEADFTSNEAMLAHTTKYLEGVYLGGAVEELSPMWVIVTGNGYVIPVMTPFIGPDDRIEEIKMAVANFIKMALQELRAVRYAFVSEAWMARLSPEENRLRGDRQIKDMDTKIEVAQIIVSDREKTSHMSLELVRDWETGKIVELKKEEEFSAPNDSPTIGGKFFNLF